MSRTTQEPFGSDLLSGAILATAGVFRSGSNTIQAGGFDRLTNMDGPVAGITPLVDNSLDKADDLQGTIYGSDCSLPLQEYLRLILK